MILWLFACTGTSTDMTDVTNGTTGTTAESGSDTGTPSLELGDPPASGVIVASLEFDGSEAVVVCPAKGPARGYGLVSTAANTVNFNKLNHSKCTTDSTEFVTFALLNVPLEDSTALPLMTGSAPVDVTMEHGGVANRRTVHESTGHAWTVSDTADGTLSATFVATWPDGRLRVWFDDARMAGL